MTAPRGYALGIDVGTTFTAAASWRDGRAEAATLGDHGDVIPSVVFLREDGVLLVGDAAERRAVSDATRVARAFKRRIGDGVALSLGGRPHTAEALTAAIVGWVVDLVTAREGGRPDCTILTLPASWRDHRRELLLDAATSAGVDDARLLAEPVTAAVHYSARHALAAGAMVGIYDLGGGTFDATIVCRTEVGFEIVGRPQGDAQLGGVDFDTLIWDHVVGVLGADTLALDDPSPGHLRAMAQLRAAVVDAKEALSYDTQATVPVNVAGLMTEVRITRAEFEQMARPALMRTVEVFGRTCELAGVNPTDLHSVLLVGGSSRIPMIAQLVGHELGARTVSDAHPKMATCLGAARAATITERKPTASPQTHLDATNPDAAATTTARAPVLAESEPATEPPTDDTPTARGEAALETEHPTPRRGRRIFAGSVLAAVAGAAIVFGVGQIGDKPEGSDTSEERATATATTPPPTADATNSTTPTTTATSAVTVTSATAESTQPSTTSTSAATTTSTSEPTLAPGSPCNPADGNPDCTDASADGTFRIIAGYAECVAAAGIPDDSCRDLDGNGEAGYPDSG